MRRFAVFLILSMATGCLEDNIEVNNKSPRTTANLVSFESCGDLHEALQQNLAEEMRVRLLSSASHGGRVGGPIREAANSQDSGREQGVDYSGTNNQEGGVDEADFVKTDGYFIYLLNGARLEIMGVPVFGELTHESTLELEGYPFQMLIGDDALTVFSQVYTYQMPEEHPLRELVADRVNDSWWYGSAILTKVTVIDISDRTNPTASRELFIEGWYQTARRVDGTVRAVSYGMMDIPGLIYWPELPDEYYQIDWDDPMRDVIWDEAAQRAIRQNNVTIFNTPLSDFVPSIYERIGQGFVEHRFAAGGCQNFAMADDGMSHGISSILSLNLESPSFSFESDHIVTNWSTVYASQDVMLLAEPAQDWWWYWNNDEFQEATNVHRFDISTAGVTTYTGSGRIDGLTLDQFSFSEYQGNVRVAATTGQWGRWWLENPPEPENHVYVLAGTSSLEVIGHVGGIAIGERIWSSRFLGDKGFLVTFRNVDPLWTIDLSNPTNPGIIGELKVPGVSTYIHPIEDSLLTIGYGGDDEGMFWWAPQISLFDVSDFAAPAVDATLMLEPPSPEDGWSYAWSEAMWEHKAFQYWNGLLAIPLSSYRSYYDNEGYYGYEYFSRLQLINVDLEGSLSLYGSIDHSDFFNTDTETYWDWRDVRRSIFMGANFDTMFIYAISDRGVSVHKVSDMSLAAKVALPGTTGYEYYWWF